MSAIKKLYKAIRMFILIHFKYKPKAYGKHFYTGFDSYIRKGTLSVGNYVFIGSRAFFSIDNIFIDDYTMIASNVSIVGGDHRFDVVGTPSIFTGRDKRVGVRIEKDSWVGNGATILDGVIIGEGSIIAAGAVVTKNVEPYGIYAGVPAKKIKDRFDSLDERLKHSEKIGGSFYKTFKHATV